MSPKEEFVEFQAEPTGFSPRSLRYLLFKKQLRTVCKLIPTTIEIDDDQIKPDFVVVRAGSAGAENLA